MQLGNFSKIFESNLDSLTLPSWLLLAETADVSVSKNNGSIGGLIFKRTATAGNKTLSIPTSPDSNLSAISLTVALNGLSSGTVGTLDLGFYGDANNYAFLRFESNEKCTFMSAKDGIQKNISDIYIQNVGWSKFKELTLIINAKHRTFDVVKNGGATYLSLDDVDVNRSALVPIIRWNNSDVATTDKLFKIRADLHFL